MFYNIKNGELKILKLLVDTKLSVTRIRKARLLTLVREAGQN